MCVTMAAGQIVSKHVSADATRTTANWTNIFLEGYSREDFVILVYDKYRVMQQLLESKLCLAEEMQERKT